MPPPPSAQHLPTPLTILLIFMQLNYEITMSVMHILKCIEMYLLPNVKGVLTMHVTSYNTSLDEPLCIIINTVNLFLYTDPNLPIIVTLVVVPVALIIIIILCVLVPIAVWKKHSKQQQQDGNYTLNPNAAYELHQVDYEEIPATFDPQQVFQPTHTQGRSMELTERVNEEPYYY